MLFCFLAKLASFQQVAQNLSSHLKRAIESRTQQHTMSQFSSAVDKIRIGPDRIGSDRMDRIGSDSQNPDRR